MPSLSDSHEAVEPDNSHPPIRLLTQITSTNQNAALTESPVTLLHNFDSDLTACQPLEISIQTDCLGDTSPKETQPRDLEFHLHLENVKLKFPKSPNLSQIGTSNYYLIGAR